MAGRNYLVVDQASLDEALAEADADDRVVVADGAFERPPEVSLRDGRWVATWDAGTIHAVETDPRGPPPVVVPGPATRPSDNEDPDFEFETNAAGHLTAIRVRRTVEDIRVGDTSVPDEAIMTLGRSAAADRAAQRIAGLFAHADYSAMVSTVTAAVGAELLELFPGGFSPTVTHGTFPSPAVEPTVLAHEREAVIPAPPRADDHEPARLGFSPAEMLAIAAELWTARGMDEVGKVTGAWHNGSVGRFSAIHLEALSHDGESGWAESLLRLELANDPAYVRATLARCVDRLASRKPPPRQA